MSTCKLNHRANEAFFLLLNNFFVQFSCFPFFLSALASCQQFLWCLQKKFQLLAILTENYSIIFSHIQDSLVRQSLECMLIQFLLGLLKSRVNSSKNSTTVIAQIVSALKTMAQNLNYGDQVLHVLNSDPIWAEFKDQNHDLFIMDSHTRGMIAGKLIKT